MTINTKGNQGCSCINNTATLTSLSDRHCLLSDGTTAGIQLTLGGSCVPFNYGSSSCRQHDLLYDPICNVEHLLAAQQSTNQSTQLIEGDDIPAYCFRPWCYVSSKTCKRSSSERVYRSSYFPIDEDVDVFYSYSTCNSTADDWMASEEDIIQNKALGEIDILGNIPTYVVPMMYKRGEDNEALTARGDEYYDDDIPYEGVYINYVNRIYEISNGDIRTLNITHKSKASSLVHPTSSFTAAVQDIQDGLVDMSVGPFWITAQRLTMAAFTLPIVYDKTYLVIEKPEISDSLAYEMQKVLEPFSWELWGLILGVIAMAACLSVWFTDRSDSAMENYDRRMGLSGNMTRTRRRKEVYARLCLDQILNKGMFFCSAGVEQDDSTSLPTKLLLFGFGFFILIAISAYVANLAAFLTLQGTSDTVKTMDEAVARGYRICAHPAIKTDLEVAWADAKFYFHEEGNEFMGILEDWKADKCDVMAVGFEDTSMDMDYLDLLCEYGLVFTDSVIAETPIAFPIRRDLSPGFSYWMYQAARLGVTLQASKDDFAEEASCNVHFSAEESAEGDELAQITARNFFFPAMFFGVFTFIGVLLQLRHRYLTQRGRQSLVGRRSTLNLTAEIDESTMRRRSSYSGKLIRRGLSSRRASKEDESDEDNEVEVNFEQNGALMRGPKTISFDDEAEKEVMDDVERNGSVVYGVSMGTGSLTQSLKVKITADEISDLQKELSM